MSQEREEVDEADDYGDDAGGVDQADDVASNHFEERGHQNVAEAVDTPLRSNETRGRTARHPRKRPVWVKDKVEEEGPKLLGVGRSKENQVVVVMQGLPSDLDSDVEMVRTSLRKGAGKAQVGMDEGDVEDDDEGGEEV